MGLKIFRKYKKFRKIFLLLLLIFAVNMRKNKYIKIMMQDDDFSKISITHNPRAKNVHIRFLPNGLLVSAPKYFTEKKILELINSERSVLLKKLNKYKKAQEQNDFLISPDRSFATLTFVVNANSAQRKDVFSSLKNGILNIEFPENEDFRTEKMQQFFWNGIDYFLHKEAVKILPEKTKQLAEKHGFTYTSVNVRSSRSRWGSCSNLKKVNLSFYLLILPENLINYVILHELCHTREMNHSEKFWKLMDKVTDNQSKALRNELKTHQIPKKYME
jgi:predicted metal-dependent hydrolase